MTEHPDSLSHDQRRSRRPNVKQKLYCSSNKVIAGVAGGLAEYVDANPRNLRIIFAVTLVWTFGFFMVPYLMLWWLLPIKTQTLEAKN